MIRPACICSSRKRTTGEGIEEILHRWPTGTRCYHQLYRPGYTHALGDRTHYSRLALTQVPPAESAMVAEGVFHAVGLPQDVRQLIIAKAEGNIAGD